MGFLPALNANAKFENGLSLNAKLENRHILSRGSFNSNLKSSEYRFERQDLAAIVGKKLSANLVIGVGYMGRLESERYIHRAIQQIAITQPLYRLRLAHRLRTDQTWDPDESFEFRIRYRFGVECPLAGIKLDPNELYIKSTLEYLARFQNDFINEIRLVPALGYYGKKKNSIELGIDYRFASVFEEIGGHGFWVYAGYYLRFNN